MRMKKSLDRRWSSSEKDVKNYNMDIIYKLHTPVKRAGFVILRRKKKDRNIINLIKCINFFI